MNNIFVSGSKASKILGVSQNTLRSYAKNNKIKFIVTPGGHRRYNINSFMNNPASKSVCYCRVSTPSQKDDLVRQVALMKSKYPTYEIISDIGSGINFQRPGLLKVIDYAIKGMLKTLVVAFRDRLCRIGYSLIEYICLNYSNTKIIIELTSDETPNERMANDLLQIVTVYGAKINGMRSYKLYNQKQPKKIKKP